jgi:hypothetical protein
LAFGEHYAPFDQKDEQVAARMRRAPRDWLRQYRERESLARAFSSEVDTGSRQTRQNKTLEHDPEKCVTVFRKDHAQSKS